MAQATYPVLTWATRSLFKMIEPYLVLLRVEFTLQPTIASGPGRSYEDWRSPLCCTCRRLTPPRRYLAPCPMEPGLSSPCAFSLQAAIILADSARSIPELDCMCSKDLAFFVNNCFIKGIFLHAKIIGHYTAGFFHWHFILK